MRRVLILVAAVLALGVFHAALGVGSLAAEDNDVKIAREMEELSESLKKVEAEIVDKEGERDRNIQEQAKAEGKKLKKLKRAHKAIADALNTLRRKERKIRLRIDAKIGELRVAARGEMVARIGDAEAALTQGKQAEAKQALVDARGKLKPWEQGFLRWSMVTHVAGELRQPPTEERKARARTELARLELLLARLSEELRRVEEEITTLEDLAKKKIEHAEWKALKDGIAALKQSVEGRKREVLRVQKQLEERKDVIEEYLE